MISYGFLVFGFCVGIVIATTVEELKHQYADVLMRCASAHPVTAQEIDVLKQKQVPDSRNVKCLLACAYKITGMMDEQGMMSVEGIHAISKDIYADDATKMQKNMEFTEVCREVNDKEVTDGTEGCDRAALLFKCAVDNVAHSKAINRKSWAGVKTGNHGLLDDIMANICPSYVKRHCGDPDKGSYMKLLNTLSLGLEEMLTELCDARKLNRYLLLVTAYHAALPINAA